MAPEPARRHGRSRARGVGRLRPHRGRAGPVREGHAHRSGPHRLDRLHDRLRVRGRGGGKFGNALEEGIYIPGLISGELGNTNATQSTTREFQNFPTPSANSAIDPTNIDVLDLWVKNYVVVKAANQILDNIEQRTTMLNGVSQSNGPPA